MKRILLVEDEVSLSSVICLNLELEGFKVDVADDGKLGLDFFNNHTYDLLIFDVMLPGMDGLSLCREVRKVNSHIPVLFLTAKSSGAERVEGLKTGADDYLVKPFNLEELIIRVHNLAKRYTGKDEKRKFKFKGGEINFSTYEIKGVNGLVEIITKREIQLLKLLIDKKNEVVSREEILNELWTMDENPSSRTIDNYILNFRKYFEQNSREPKHFHSIRGVGYKFTV